MNYQSLDPEKVVATIDGLHHRICERFPESGLSRVCERLLHLGRQGSERAAAISNPNIFLRIGCALLIMLIVAGLASGVLLMKPPDGGVSFVDLIQALEAAINEVVFVGLVLIFLASLETRFKRARALAALHELRVVAHIIDMHQLTKDPEYIQGRGQQTASSPARLMTPFELNRYLDYCTEMLSMVGKLAVLYVQSFNDPAAVTAVNEIESLTNGLSRKIWQKLMILHTNSLQEANT